MLNSGRVIFFWRVQLSCSQKKSRFQKSRKWTGTLNAYWTGREERQAASKTSWFCFGVCWLFFFLNLNLLSKIAFFLAFVCIRLSDNLTFVFAFRFFFKNVTQNSIYKKKGDQNNNIMTQIFKKGKKGDQNNKICDPNFQKRSKHLAMFFFF